MHGEGSLRIGAHARSDRQRTEHAQKGRDPVGGPPWSIFVPRCSPALGARDDGLNRRTDPSGRRWPLRDVRTSAQAETQVTNARDMRSPFPTLPPGFRSFAESTAGRPVRPRTTAHGGPPTGQPSSHDGMGVDGAVEARRSAPGRARWRRGLRCSRETPCSHPGLVARSRGGRTRPRSRAV